MRILSGNKIETILNIQTKEFGILADTAFLYALSDTEDRLNKSAMKVQECLEIYNVPVFANVISRMEFIDLLFRKQITADAIEVFHQLDPKSENKNLYNFLKSIRDENTAFKRDGQSYKVNEGKLKKLKFHISSEADLKSWKDFCLKYLGETFSNDWQVFEQEIGLNFVEVLEGSISEIISEPLHWVDMVKVMGQEGIRGPDAMIVNLFLKSRFPLLITSDKDIAHTFDGTKLECQSKTIIYLE